MDSGLSARGSCYARRRLRGHPASPTETLTALASNRRLGPERAPPSPWRVRFARAGLTGACCYITYRLYNAEVMNGRHEGCGQGSERYICGARGSDPARHPQPARDGPAVGGGAGPAVRHEPAGHLKASQGAGARRPDFARPRRAAAPTTAGGQAARRGHRMAGAVPRVLGGQLLTPRRAARRAEGQAEETEVYKTLEEITP